MMRAALFIRDLALLCLFMLTVMATFSVLQLITGVPQ
jgi:hypothetical protein